MNYAFAGDSFHFGKTHTKRRANWRWHSGAEPIPACWEEEGGPLAMEARNSARLARDAEGQISTVKLPSSFPRATREHTMNSRSPWSLPPLSVTLKIRRGGAATSPVAQDPHAPAAGRAQSNRRGAVPRREAAHGLRVSWPPARRLQKRAHEVPSRFAVHEVTEEGAVARRHRRRRGHSRGLVSEREPRHRGRGRGLLHASNADSRRPTPCGPARPAQARVPAQASRGGHFGSEAQWVTL